MENRVDEETNNQVSQLTSSSDSSGVGDTNSTLQQRNLLDTARSPGSAIATTPSSESEQQQRQDGPQKAVVHAVKPQQDKGVPDASTHTVNSTFTDKTLTSTPQATAALPLQGQTAGHSNRPQITVIKVATQNGSNASTAAFAVVKLPQVDERWQA